MNHYNWEYEYHSFYQEIKTVKYRYISGTKMLEDKASQFQGSSKLIQNPYNYSEATSNCGSKTHRSKRRSLN